MYKGRKQTRYYRWLLQSKKHTRDFQDWLIAHGFDIYANTMFIRGEVIAFNGKGGRGSLFETGLANDQCLKQIALYLKSTKKTN